MTPTTLSWFGIVRLGLAQTGLGAIVVLTTSTLNRIMVVELMLPAIVPGLLVAWHFALQMLRPRWGHGADTGGRPTRWVIAGTAILATGGFGAALATALMTVNMAAGIALAVVAFTLIGLGVGASGTSILTLLAKRVAPERRAAAATIVWVMMIAGFVVTSALSGHYLDPFSTERLLAVAAVICVVAVAVATLAVFNLDPPAASIAAAPTSARPAFREALREVWADAPARRFTIFVFVSMLAYSAQDLILEPYAGLLFGFTPGQSTKLSGVQHAGVLVGMIGVAVIASFASRRAQSLPLWTAGGCLASAASLIVLAAGAFVGPEWPLRACVFVLGVSNGAYAIAAIGSMMALAGRGRTAGEGVRMGVWGAAQATAFGIGGLVGAGLVDILKLLIGTPHAAYAITFGIEALAFLASAGMALAVMRAADGGGQSADRVTFTGLGQSMLQPDGGKA